MQGNIYEVNVRQYYRPRAMLNALATVFTWSRAANGLVLALINLISSGFDRKYRLEVIVVEGIIPLLNPEPSIGMI